MSNNRKKETKELRPAKIHVIGDGDTEFYYFKHLKKLRGFKCELKRSLFHNSSIVEMGKTLEGLSGNQVPVICVFDLDSVEKDKTVRGQLKQLKDQYSGVENFLFCGSFPSIEYWFLLHYEDKNGCLTSDEALEKLRKYIDGYEKTRSFLQTENWVKDLSDRLDSAITKAETFNSRDCECLNDCLGNKPICRSCTDLYKAFALLEPKSNSNTTTLSV